MRIAAALRTELIDGQPHGYTARHRIMVVERLIVLGIVFATGLCASTGSPATAEDLWHSQVEPLLDRNCFKCHGGVRQKGGLDLRSLENMLKGGDQGPAIVPGQPGQSHVFEFVQPEADPHMPPDDKKQLTGEEIAVVKAWIEQLPPVDRLLPAASATNSNWVSEYVAALKKSRTPVWTPPETMPASEVIDGFVALEWEARGIEPSAISDDRAFLRRVYLDLAGRIPTVQEAESLLTPPPDWREVLVEKLLANDEYARRMRDVFDVVLMDRLDESTENRRRNRGPQRDERWYRFLEDSFRANRPWNKIVRDLVLGRPSGDTDRGAVWFLYERNNNHQAMAEAVAPVAFGIQIKCAQCHNDPLAAEVEQRHYWGLVAAFNRSKNVDTAQGIGVAEAAIGGFVNFQNLKKESQPALLALLTGQSVEEKRPAENEKEIDAPDLYQVPPPKEKEKPASPSVPKFSRREILADAVTRDNPMLAPAFVNRIWAMFLGRGLVHPVDQMDARHRPSHPDLLDWLARDFERSGYDIKRLVRSIVLSRTYQLDSRPRGQTPPPPESFARALEKPLTAEQLVRSFLTAAGLKQDAEGKFAGREEAEIRRAIAARFPEVFPIEHNTSLQQAVFLSNSALLDDLLKHRPGSTSARLLELDSNEARVRHAFLAVLGRKPDAEELSRLIEFLDRRETESGLRQVLWALLMSAEFLVNH